MSVAEDDEIRTLFEAEALERLTRLGELLLRLEAEGGNDHLIASLFREAHTLRGSADMVGLSELAEEADALETILDELRAGARGVDAGLVDDLFVRLDRLSVLTGIPVPTSAPIRTVPSADPTPVSSPVVAAPIAAPEPDPAPKQVPEPAPAPDRHAERATARVAVERLDELVRLAGEASAAHQKVAGDALSESPALRALGRHLTDIQDRTLRARMLPISDLVPALRRTARDVARRMGKEVNVVVLGETTELDREVHERLADALLHVIRNAVDHGIEEPSARAAVGKPAAGTITLEAAQVGTRVLLTVSDDGRGVDRQSVARRAETLGVDTAALTEDAFLDLLFQPGFSTAAPGAGVSGRGVGLDAVRDVVVGLRGRVEVSSVRGQSTSFRISVPTTLAVLQSLIVVAGGTRCALALHGVGSVLAADTGEVQVEGRAAVFVGPEIVPLGSLGAMLGQPDDGGGPIVVLRSGRRVRAVRVEQVIGQREVVVKPLPRWVAPSDVVVGAAAEADGSVLLVLDVDAVIDLNEGAWWPQLVPVPEPEVEGEVAPAARVLVVDDALTVRELQKTILERAGYEVRTATDGADALARLAESPVDLVLSDIEMEGMDGLRLTRSIRADPRWRNLPVVLLTSRGGDEDRRRGLEAGADAYIVKASFEARTLLGIVSDLLGREAS